MRILTLQNVNILLIKKIKQLSNYFFSIHFSLKIHNFLQKYFFISKVKLIELTIIFPFCYQMNKIFCFSCKITPRKCVHYSVD